MNERLHRWVVALILAVNAALIGAFLLTADLSRVLNNAIDIWFDQSDPSLPAYRAEQATFGEGSWVFVNLWTETPQQADAASLKLTEEFRLLDGIVSVLSPHDIDVLQEDDEGLFFDILTEDVGWQERHQRLAEHPIAGIVLANADEPNRVGFLLEEGTGVAAGGAQRQLLLSQIRALLEQTEGVVESTVTGSAVINAELNRLSWIDILILLPVTGTIVMLIGLVLLRRNMPAFASIFGVVIIVMCSSMAAMLLSGTAFNMVTIALPGILFTLGIASGLHVCQYIAENRERPVAELSKGLFRPLMVSHLTTALGFGLLMMITVLPVQSMAFWGALGVLWSGLHMAVVLPAMLMKTKGDLHLPELGMRHWLPRLLTFAEALVARPVALALAFVALTTLIVFGVSKLTFDSTYLNMVAQDEQMRQDYDLLAARDVPSAQLNVVLRADRTDGIVSADLNKAMAALAQDFLAIDGVQKVLGPPQIYGETAPRLREDIPQATYDADPNTVTDSYVFALTGGNREVGRYLNYDLNAFRLVVMFEYLPNSALRSLVDDKIEPAVAMRIADIDGVSAEISGLTILWANMDDAIATGQITSLAILAFICFSLFLVSYRSLRLAVTATFVNLLPVATIAMVLGLLGLPIDMAAVFILSLLLGIATDDTSFYINSYVRKRAEGKGLAEVLNEVVPAMVITSVLITIGFFVLLASSFVPIQTFGVFTALGIICATIADVVVLTFLLLPFHQKGRTID